MKETPFLKVMSLKEDFMYNMDMFLHKNDKFLYYREDDMPDMVRIDTSSLKHEVHYLLWRGDIPGMVRIDTSRLKHEVHYLLWRG